MGQGVSTDSDGVNSHDFEKVELSKDDIITLFQKKCRGLLRPVELKAITSKINSTNLNEKNILTPSDLAYILQISGKHDDVSTVHKNFGNAIHIVYDAVKVVGLTPFIGDVDVNGGNMLTVDDLIVASVFHSGRYKKILPDYDYLKLLFISLSSSSLVNYVKFHAKKEVEGNLVAIKALKPSKDHEELGPRLLWKSLSSFKNYDYIDINDLYMNGFDLHQLLTLFLLLSSIPKSNKVKMEQTLHKLLQENWLEFEDSALCMLKFLNINYHAKTLKTTKIKYDELFNNEVNFVVNLITAGFNNLFRTGFLSSNFDDTITLPPGDVTGTKITINEFPGSKLINNATISSLSAALKAIGSETQITTENLIKLYIGKEAGFSIRSLELKIFKWQAPTLLIVSGKRLKQKTETTNKRYLQFDSEFPRHFRSKENHLKSWQSDNDRITYGVLINQPWRASNKKNFGDMHTVIFSISPLFDYIKSSTNPILKGELIYFNTLGMGLGFGNDQPINKNNVRKYLPGDVSLTIESNLEFAVFRHVNSGSTATYFNKSNQPQLKSEEFEDRFMITDLEVWGIGSTKELDQQRKQWEWEQKQAEARQNVNMQTLGDDRAFLEMVGLVGNHGGSGGSV